MPVAVWQSSTSPARPRPPPPDTAASGLAAMLAAAWPAARSHASSPARPLPAPSVDTWSLDHGLRKRRRALGTYHAIQTIKANKESSTKNREKNQWARRKAKEARNSFVNDA